MAMIKKLKEKFSKLIAKKDKFKVKPRKISLTNPPLLMKTARKPSPARRKLPWPIQNSRIRKVCARAGQL